MREVIESIRYAAAPGKYRMFIIDEVHMLSTPAFNALLKTLEEPPPRSLFVFATTNPEKIPFTVLSRCQRHDLRRIALSTVTERLAEICASEGIEISPAALAQVAREGDGSMRDAQTLLDQIVAYGGEQVSDETVAELLDLVDRHLLRSIVEACIDADPKTALELVGQATAGGSEARRIADALLELLRDLVVLRIAPEGQGLFEGPEEEREELIRLAGRTEPARLRRMFRALVREIEDLSWAPRPTAVLEMAVVRLATLPTGDDVAQLLTRLDQLERRLSRDPTSGPNGAPTGSAAGGRRTAPPAASRGRSDRSRSVAPPEARRDDERTSPSGPSPGPGHRAVGRAGRADAGHASLEAPASEAPPVADAPPVGSPPVGAPPVGAWPDEGTNGPASALDPVGPSSGAPEESSPGLGGGAPPEVLFDRLRAKALETDRARFASLDVASLIELRGQTLGLGVPGAFHAERLLARRAEIEALGERLFGRPIRVTVEMHEAKTAREMGSDQREVSRRRRQEALNSEPVNLALQILEGEIIEIRPLGESR